MSTIEPYRREIFVKALHTFRPDGAPVCNMVLSGRAKKNHKSSDLVETALFKLLIPDSPQGNDGYILGNDEDQAADDLSLAKKLVAANAAEIGGELEVIVSEIKRRDGRGSLKILPARNVVGQHGKTAIFIGFDEIHGYRDYDLLEALAPDPTQAAADIILRRLTDAGFKVVEDPVAGVREVQRLRAEVDRLQEAKRRALQIADERAKEAVELRRQIETLQGGAR
jgi:hypothetical protein